MSSFLTELFAVSSMSVIEATEIAQNELNGFLKSEPIERIVSVTTNTNHSWTPAGNALFVYTLTLVYEPQEKTSEEAQEKLDEITQQLTEASARLEPIHKDETLSQVWSAICFSLNTLDELNAKYRA